MLRASNTFINNQQVNDFISYERISPYVRITKNMKKAVELYLWNIEASGAVLELIAFVEIIVRNRITFQLATHFAGQNQDWYSKLELDRRGTRDLERALTNLSSRREPITPGESYCRT